MKKKYVLVIAVLLLGLCAGNVFADGEEEVYIVATDAHSYNNYLLSNGNGTLTTQQSMGKPDYTYYDYCYGNGIGDFDNDGDYDYIMGVGYSNKPKKVYLYEKIGPGKTFALPVEVGIWSAGRYPMDMALADYNEDGNLDFVMNHYQSDVCELYLGNGMFEFSRSLLHQTSPYYSIGADSADVNNDGHADFVTAPYSDRPAYFYVNLGNGQGGFTTSTVRTHGDSFYWGMAAADFDGDGNVDLIATYSNYLDFYTGDGNGNFHFSYRSTNGNFFSNSSMDNFDLDGDGDQDLVLGTQSRVAVFLNKGNGHFVFLNNYYGGQGSNRIAISAPYIKQNFLKFEIGSVQVQNGIISALGQEKAALAGIGEFVVTLDLKGVDNPDLQSLTVSNPLFSITSSNYNAQSRTIELILAIPDFYTTAGDYEVTFSIDYEGGPLKTENSDILTVLSPGVCSQAVSSSLSAIMAPLEDPSWAAQMNNKVAANLQRSAQSLTALYPEGYTPSAQELADSIEDTIALAEGILEGLETKDIVSIRNNLRFAINYLDDKVTPELSEFRSLSRENDFVKLLNDLDMIQEKLEQASLAAPANMQAEIDLLIIDNFTLKTFVYYLAEEILGSTEGLPGLFQPFDEE